MVPNKGYSSLDQSPDEKPLVALDTDRYESYFIVLVLTTFFISKGQAIIYCHLYLCVLPFAAVMMTLTCRDILHQDTLRLR